MIDQLAARDKVLNFQARNLTTTLSESQRQLYNRIDDYLAQYVHYFKLTVDDVVKRHNQFLSRFSQDLKEFEKTGNYPVQTTKDGPFDRVTYDISLLLSCLLTAHRFAIMDELNRFDPCGEASLFIGVGTGLELALLRHKINRYCAFDVSISDFVRDQCPKSSLRESPFKRSTERYSSIFCIELLEHVEDPDRLVGELVDSLNEGGRLVATTAKDIPQLDHIVNFTDEKGFEEKTEKMGLQIEYKRKINHQSLFSKVDSNNIFYIFTK